MEAAPPFYSLRNLATESAAGRMEKLRGWLSGHHKEGQWDAKLYVARTIYWNSDPPEFRQAGCSPNYHAGLWSLACCKYEMRRAKPFQGQIENYAIPTFVFTLSSKAAKGSQALVSVAKITNHFETMDDYAKFIVKSNNPHLIASRLTRIRNDEGLLGRRFGDCHANRQAQIGAPATGHVHEHCWQSDVDGTHLILISDDFLLWGRPVFFARKTIKRSRYGTNLTAGNLVEILTSK